MPSAASGGELALAMYTNTCTLSRVKRRDLEKALRKLGWSLLRHGGNHDVWSDAAGNSIAVPRHVEINERLAQAILRQASK